MGGCTRTQSGRPHTQGGGQTQGPSAGSLSTVVTQGRRPQPIAAGSPRSRGAGPTAQGPIDPGSRRRSRSQLKAASAAHRWIDRGVFSFRTSWAGLATRCIHFLLAMNWCPAGQNWGSRGAQRRRLMSACAAGDSPPGEAATHAYRSTSGSVVLLHHVHS
jgi:hypothetical protein